MVNGNRFSAYPFPSLPSFLSLVLSAWLCSFALVLVRTMSYPFPLLSWLIFAGNDASRKIFSDYFPGMESQISLVAYGLASLARKKLEFIFELLQNTCRQSREVF